MGKRKGRKKKGESHGDAPERFDEGRDDTGEAEGESSAAECRYAEMRGRGKTVRQIRAVAVARNDHDLAELCDGIIEGTRVEPDAALPGGDDSEAVTDDDQPEAADDGNSGNEPDETGDTDTPAENAEDAEGSGGDGDASTSGEDGEGGGVVNEPADTDSTGMNASEADGEGGEGEDSADAEETPEEQDTRPVVSMEELRAIDAELPGLLNRFREAAGEMNHLRERLAELQRTRRAMGPVARAARTPREAGAPRKPGLLTLAANLLAENGRSMGCKAIVQELDERGLWSPGIGKTPDASLHAAISTEIKTRGDQSRFIRAGKGLFAASEHGLALYRAAQGNAASVEDAAGAEGAVDPET